MNNDWYEKGEKPPVHENVEWRGKHGGYWVKARVVDYTEEQICFLHHSDQKYKPCKMEVFNFSDIFIQPLKSDREKAIEAMKKICEEVEETLIHPSDVPFSEREKCRKEGFEKMMGAAYDAGLLRLPEDKND